MCVCVCSLHVVGHLGEGDEGDFPFFKNQERFLDELWYTMEYYSAIKKPLDESERGE